MSKKYALITGACGGIGKALTQEFSDAGYSVIATDILDEPVHGVVCDYYVKANLAKTVAEENYAQIVISNVHEFTKGRGISALVNNAAEQILASTEKLTREDWQTTLNVNLLAPFFLSQGFLEQLKLNKGCIVNISSIHATQTKRRFVAYATSKAALSSLTRNMAVDLSGEVRVNAIEPAAVATDMLKAGFEGMPDKYAELERYHPIGRIADPKEIAELAVYLCSEKSRFLQGATISASGGIHGCLSDPD